VRLWTRDTDELVLAAPVDASEDGSVGGTERVAIVALDGTVMLLDAVTGDPVWRHGVAADVSAAPLVAGGTVVVVDRAGHRTAFRASDGKRLWSLDGDPASTGFVAGGVPILVGDDGFLRGIDTASGQELWSTRYLGFERGVADVDGVAILATDEQVIALDPDTGMVAWSRPGVTGAVTDGHALIVFGDDTAILLDGSGTETARWTVPSLLSSINRYALAVADGIVLFRSFQPVTVLGAP
jgi:outer membrane protein assembly factor BamB